MSIVRNVRWVVMVVLGGLVLLGPTRSALAIPITFIYEGTIDDLGPGVGNLAFQAFLGQTLRVEYTFESTTPDDASPGIPDLGEYIDAITQIMVTAGPNTYTNTTVPEDIVVENGFAPEDGYRVRSGNLNGPLVGPSHFFVFDLNFVDTTETVFPTDDLPLTPPDPADFDSITFELRFVSDADGSTVGTLGASTVIIPQVGGPAVPKPITATLGLMGLGVLGMATRRRVT